MQLLLLGFVSQPNLQDREHPIFADNIFYCALMNNLKNSQIIQLK